MCFQDIKMNQYFLIISLTIVNILVLGSQAQSLKKKNPNKPSETDNVVAELQVVCRSDSIVLNLNTNTPFNGMVYAKDAPNSNGCVSEFQSSTNMTFRLPLKSCGTLFAEVDDGIEYFNTVMVQPHMRLMTNLGKGYHIRCKYQTRERTIANTHFNVSASFPMQNGLQAATTPLLATASMPSCTMKIFRSGRDDVAETVKIGDKLIMVIEIDQQDMYGMKITNCVVRDGLNVAEQQLINDQGCPVDEAIMPRFEYSNNSTRAAVSFPAHKFPHTSSIYYQCNVRLCINNGGCEQPDCTNSSSQNTNGGPRRKRFVSHDSKSPTSRIYRPLSGPVTGELPIAPLPEPSALKAGVKGKDMSFDVYSGLYVSDVDVAESGSSDANNQQVSPSRRETDPDNNDEVCLTIGKATLVIMIASMASVGVIVALMCQIGVLGYNREIRPSTIVTSDYHLDRNDYNRRNTKGQQQYRHGCDASM